MEVCVGDSDKLTEAQLLRALADPGLHSMWSAQYTQWSTGDVRDIDLIGLEGFSDVTMHVENSGYFQKVLPIVFIAVIIFLSSVLTFESPCHPVLVLKTGDSTDEFLQVRQLENGKAKSKYVAVWI